MRRGVSIVMGVLACAVAGLFAAAVVATPGLSQLPITTGTTAATTTTTRTVEADLIAEGVWVGRVEVGGLTPEGARALVQSEFDEALRLRFGHLTILVTPQRLGATARVKLAIDQARRAEPNTRLPLFVNLRAGGVARYVKALGRRFDRRGKERRVARPATAAPVDHEGRRRSHASPACSSARASSRRCARDQRAVLRIRADTHRPGSRRARASARSSSSAATRNA